MNATAPSRFKSILSILASLVIVSFSAFVVYRLYFIGKQVTTLSTNYSSLTADKGDLEEAYDTLLFEDHLAFLVRYSIEQSKTTIEQEYEKFKSEAEGERLAKIEAVYSAYQDAVSKIERNSDVGLDTSSVSDKLSTWGQQFLNQDFDTLNQELADAQSTLDTQHQDYLTSLPTPTPTPQPVAQKPAAAAPAGYTYQSVSTSRGTFSTYLIKMKLSEVTVKTVAANTSDCKNNCPTKSLQQYVSENGAYAGMHGTYFCPPDYSQCAGKVNSYDYPVYDSNAKSWRNANALKWDILGMIGFNGKSVSYAGNNISFSGSVTAGISNFPMLLENGKIVTNNYPVDNYQATAHGSRGAIGTDDTYIYLAISTGATVPDMAYVMKALGAKNALNLDGGGSSAMYIGGSYKVGPGRSLPNAILLIKN